MPKFPISVLVMITGVIYAIATLGSGKNWCVVTSKEFRKPIALFLVSTHTVSMHSQAETKGESNTAIEELKKFLATKQEDRPSIGRLDHFEDALSREEAEQAVSLLIADRGSQLKTERAEEMEKREITIGNLKMPFDYKIFGEKPASGRSLVISMHGGGGAPPRVNTSQWENQKKLYQLEEGVYLAPRAPTDTWDLWHQSHIDGFFERLIENLVVFEGVNSNRVYLMGYSAGGDGVYQLAPRMADRFAAASMMAGHPNETSPLGLRNLPFAIHMGEKDSAYNRNQTAKEWKDKLAALRDGDPKGYEHVVKIHEGKGHWMDKQDAEAIPWMARMERNSFPGHVVWKQDDVKQNRFYWLAVESSDVRDRGLVIAKRDGQTIELKTADADRIRILMNDSMMNLEEPITVKIEGKVLFAGRVQRTIKAIVNSIQERFDPNCVYTAQISVSLPKPE